VTTLRQGLLDGRAVALAGGVPAAVGEALAALGARVHRLAPGLDEDATNEWALRSAPLHAVVFDAAPAFGEGGQDGLRDALELAWVATRGVATGALIPGGKGKVVLIAPHVEAGPFAAAARDALENLARTLSVEWARYGVTAVAIAPGARGAEAELADLVSYLVSPAGDYFSGCRFDLGAGELARAGTIVR
jgi:hypothetical protein